MTKKETFGVNFWLVFMRRDFFYDNRGETFKNK